MNEEDALTEPCKYCGAQPVPERTHYPDCDRPQGDIRPSDQGDGASGSARTAEANPELDRRCVGCGHRWHSNHCICELCGDCWRRVQPVLHGTPELDALREALTTILDWRERDRNDLVRQLDITERLQKLSKRIRDEARYVRTVSTKALKWEQRAKSYEAWADELDAALSRELEADALARLLQENEQLRETNKRLNRRCQIAEGAANLKIEEWGKRRAKQGRNYIFQLGKDAGRAEAEAELARVTAERNDEHQEGEETGGSMTGPAFQKDMTPAEAAHFIRQIAETTASASQNWENFEQIVLGMINAAMDAARAYGKSEAPPKWQPIDTAPKDGTEVLLVGKNWKRTGWWARRTEAWSVDAPPGLSDALYWMPLPPEVTAENQNPRKETRGR